MFVLTQDELADWRRQFGTSNSERMELRFPPMAFTEQGVAVLSSLRIRIKDLTLTMIKI